MADIVLILNAEELAKGAGLQAEKMMPSYEALDAKLVFSTKRGEVTMRMRHTKPPTTTPTA